MTKRQSRKEGWGVKLVVLHFIPFGRQGSLVYSTVTGLVRYSGDDHEYLC